MAIVQCPKCKSQLEVRVGFASGPKASSPSNNADLAELMEKIDPATLSGKDLEFYEGFKERYDQYGERTHCSEKQMKWLEDLASKGF